LFGTRVFIKRMVLLCNYERAGLLWIPPTP
jgi:hypothetical protein